MKSSKKTRAARDPLAKDQSSKFDKPGWSKFNYELRRKDKTITLRIGQDLLNAIKAKAESEGLDYQKWIRNSLEESLNRSA